MNTLKETFRGAVLTPKYPYPKAKAEPPLKDICVEARSFEEAAQVIVVKQKLEEFYLSNEDSKVYPIRVSLLGMGNFIMCSHDFEVELQRDVKVFCRKR